jgi:hypothetical protein
LGDTSKMDDLARSFCELPARRELYEYVSNRTPVTVVAIESGTWDSQTVDGRTTISQAPSKQPQACLAHELLHAKLKLDGYKQYFKAICRTGKKSSIARVLGALDNELQHHKFYKDFLGLGFAAREMYNDNDTETSSFIREELSKLQGANSPTESYFYLFISIIAPGGCIEDKERRELLDLLEQKTPLRYWKKLTRIEGLFKSFAEGSTLDAGDTVVQILESLGEYDPTWIAPDLNFPQSGLFVGDSFTEEDLKSGWM